MKKFLASLLAIITVCFMTVAFAACSDEPSGGGNKGENGAPVSYTVTAEEWDSALDICCNLISDNGVVGNFTAESDTKSDDGTGRQSVLKLDDKNQTIYYSQTYNSESNTNQAFYFKISGVNVTIYRSINNGDWSKFEGVWELESQQTLMRALEYSELGTIVGNDDNPAILSTLKGLYNNAEYNSNTREYSFAAPAPLNSMLTKLKLIFENRKIVKIEYIEQMEYFTGSFFNEFSDYGTTTVTIPQEVIDNAVLSN